MRLSLVEMGEVMVEFKNNLLKRKEVQLLIEADSNPGFSEGRKKISEEFGVEDGQILMRNVYSKFGRRTFLIDAFIYDSKEEKEKLHGVEKKEGAEGESAGVEGSQEVGKGETGVGGDVNDSSEVEEKKEEVKVEEKKEEVKVEEKKEEVKEGAAA